MNLDEILELIALLEGEAPTSLSEAMRLKADALQLMLWLRQEVGHTVLQEGIEKRCNLIFDKANEAIGRWTAKPRLCLNA